MDVSSDEVASAAARVNDAALTAARLAAAELVANALAAGGITLGGSPMDLAVAFTRRDPDDGLYQAIIPYEQSWALLAVRFAEAAARTSPLIDALAAADARDRGVTWQAIADELGITQQSAHGRYADPVPGRGKRPATR